MTTTQCIVPRDFSKDLLNNGKLDLNRDVIMGLLKWKMSFLAKGAYNSVILVEKSGCEPRVLRVGFYRRYMLRQIDGVPRNEDGYDSVIVDAMFSKAVRQYKIPGFVKIDAVAEIPSSRLMAFVDTDIIKKLDLTQLSRPIVFAMDKYEADLTEFLRRGDYDDNILKALIFQVLFSLHEAGKRFKNFRHNDLSTNNIFVNLVRVNGVHTRKPLKFAFTVGGKAYEKTFETSAETFIGDFEFIYCQQSGMKNERIFNYKYKIKGGRNRSYDTNYFLFCIKQLVSKRFPKSSVVEWITKLGVKKPRISAEKKNIFVEKLLIDKFLN